MKKEIRGVFVIVALCLFLSSCGTVITGASPYINQAEKEFGVTVKLAQDYSPPVNIIFPLRINIGGTLIELASISISGKGPDRDEAEVMLLTNLGNFERYYGDIVDFLVTNQLPNGVGPFSRLRTGGKSFITEPFLWSIGLFLDDVTGLSDSFRVGVRHDKASKSNGIIYTPVVGEDGTLPQKLYFGGVVRLDVFAQDPVYEVQFAIPFELRAEDGSGNSVVYAIAGILGAGDQGVGEYPGVFVFLEINALRSLTASVTTEVSEVNLGDNKNDHVILPKGSKTTRKDVIENVEVLYEKLKDFSL